MLQHIPIEGRDDAATGKRVHMAHGSFPTPINYDIGVSLLAALPDLLERGEIKVRMLNPVSRLVWMGVILTSLLSSQTASNSYPEVWRVSRAGSSG